MAAVAAELVFRDGKSEKIQIKVENNLSSVIKAVHKLNEEASKLLSELVERENPRSTKDQGEEEEDESDEDDPLPPAKRSKT